MAVIFSMTLKMPPPSFCFVLDLRVQMCCVFSPCMCTVSNLSSHLPPSVSLTPPFQIATPTVRALLTMLLYNRIVIVMSPLN